MSPRATRITLFAFAVLVLGGVLAWAAHTLSINDIEGLHRQAGTSTLWGMNACVVLGAAGLAAAIPFLRDLLSRRDLLVALVLVAAGYLVCGLAPRATRILFDEHLYLQIGQTIAHAGVAEGARSARVEYGEFQLYSGWVNKQPNGWPYVVAQVYRVFGVSVAAGHELNRVLVGLTAALLFLALRLAPWTLPRGAPLAAGILFILTPLVPWWGNTASVETSTAAFATLVFAAACLHIRLRDRITAQGRPCTACLLGAATAFACYFRPESMLVFPLVTMILWSTEDRFAKDLTAWAALLFALALVTPNLLQLWAVRGENWGATDGRRFDFAFVGQNFASNAGYFFTSRWFPLAGTAFFGFGVGWLLLRAGSVLLALGVWFAFAWGTFVVFYAGGYHYGASSRFAIVSTAPVAVFMGVGAAAAFAVLRRRPGLLGAVAAAVALNWAAAAHYVPTLSREAVEAQKDIVFVSEIAAKLPQGSLVISRIPCAWLLANVNSAELSELSVQLASEMHELRNQNPGGVYLHYGFWENVEPHMANECADLVAATSAVEVYRTTSHHQVFQILRLDTPEVLARQGGLRPLYPPRAFKLRGPNDPPHVEPPPPVP